jgi:AcrR family transcriptional regulator
MFEARRPAGNARFHALEPCAPRIKARAASGSTALPGAAMQASRTRDRTSAPGAFAAKGADVPLDEIARRAGVGNATLYRNFPTRRDLIVAGCVGEVEALVSYGERLSSSKDPRKALQEWIGRFIEHIASDKGLAAALMAGASEDSAVVDACNAAIGGIVAELMTNAQSAGAIRTDVDGADLMSVANAVRVTETDFRSRWNCWVAPGGTWNPADSGLSKCATEMEIDFWTANAFAIASLTEKHPAIELVRIHLDRGGRQAIRRRLLCCAVWPPWPSARAC